MNLQELKILEVGEQHCPNCGKKLNRVSTFENKVENIKPNDFTVCIKCEFILRFDDKLQLRIVSVEELEEYYKEDPAGHLQLYEARALVHIYNLERKNIN